MKSIEFETSKGRFMTANEEDLVFKDKNGITYAYHNGYLIDWFSRIKLSEITEEQASEVIKMTWINDNIKFCKYKNYIQDGKGSYSSAIESLHSLLKSKGIEITPNTYIFKL